MSLQAEIKDGLDNLGYELSFLSEVVLAESEKNNAHVPLTPRAWVGFYLFTKVLLEQVNHMRNQAKKLE